MVGAFGDLVVGWVLVYWLVQRALVEVGVWWGGGAVCFGVVGGVGLDVVAVW